MNNTFIDLIVHGHMVTLRSGLISDATGLTNGIDPQEMQPLESPVEPALSAISTVLFFSSFPLQTQSLFLKILNIYYIFI